MSHGYKHGKCSVNFFLFYVEQFVGNILLKFLELAMNGKTFIHFYLKNNSNIFEVFDEFCQNVYYYNFKGI